MESTSPRKLETLKIELPVVDNSGNDDEEDEEDIAAQQPAELVTQTQEKSQNLVCNSKESEEKEITQVENESGKEKQAVKDEDVIDHNGAEAKYEKGLDQGDTTGQKRSPVNTVESPTNISHSAVHNDSSADRTVGQNNGQSLIVQNNILLNLDGAKVTEHSDTETVVSYDPTGTHIIEYNENQSYLNVANELGEKQTKMHHNPGMQNVARGSKIDHSGRKFEQSNKNKEEMSREIERSSDTLVRPVKHQRRPQTTLTAEEEALGIYEDTAEGDDLTDTELEVLKSRYRGSKVTKECEKVVEETEPCSKDKVQIKPDIQENLITKPIAEVFSRTKHKINSAPRQLQDVHVRDFKEFKDRLEKRGRTAVSCITDVFEESRNASRLALESREAMFRRAMTLLSARCTSMKQGLDPEEMKVPFGVQVPKYIYVTQEKPLPMEPLRAWRGYNGNVYFEPIQVNPLKNTPQSPKEGGRLQTKQSQRKSEPEKVPPKVRPDSQSESVQTAKSSTSAIPNRPTTRQMAILDKQTVINKYNESLHEDILWLEGQENTGSLAIRPRIQSSHGRKKDLLYNKERICKGSVAHKLYVEKNTSSKRPRFSVSGGKFTPPNSMSPLLRTQTQYSLSSNRLTTNSPDLYHLNDSKLPALDQIKASLKHSDGSREKTYTRPLTITAEMKPFVKYSPDVVKLAQQAM